MSVGESVVGLAVRMTEEGMLSWRLGDDLDRCAEVREAETYEAVATAILADVQSDGDEWLAEQRRAAWYEVLAYWRPDWQERRSMDEEAEHVLVDLRAMVGHLTVRQRYHGAEG